MNQLVQSIFSKQVKLLLSYSFVAAVPAIIQEYRSICTIVVVC